MRRTLLAVFLGICVVSPAAFSAAFEKATLTIVVHDVSLGRQGASGGERRAKVSDTILPANYILSGVDSRAEMRFADNSLVRVGENTVFSFAEGSRVLSLKKGAALFFMPKGSAATTFKTPTLTASITGSAVSSFVIYGPGDALEAEGIGSTEPGGHVTVEGVRVPAGQIYIRRYHTDGTTEDIILTFDPTTGLLYNMALLPFEFTLTVDLEEGLKMPDIDALTRQWEQYERALIDPLRPPRISEPEDRPEEEHHEEPPVYMPPDQEEGGDGEGIGG